MSRVTTEEEMSSEAVFTKSAGREQASETGFASLHPVVNFAFFVFVLLVTVFFLHPVFLGISLFASLVYAVRLNGWRQMRILAFVLVPMMIIAVLVNILFNHRGQTLLSYLPDGNPLTLESVVYGLAAAAMIAAVILWFSCYNKVMTSDKFLYLFSRVIPSLALVISMALRLIPRYKAQITRIAAAQSAIGRGVGVSRSDSGSGGASRGSGSGGAGSSSGSSGSGSGSGSSSGVSSGSRSSGSSSSGSSSGSRSGSSGSGSGSGSRGNRVSRSLTDRIRSGIVILSAMVTWALENGVETAASMQSRGYGLPGRSAWSLYHWQPRDLLTLALMLYFAALTVLGIFLGVVQLSFFPLVNIGVYGPFGIAVCLAFAIACMLPLLVDGFEAYRWHLSRSKI